MRQGRGASVRAAAAPCAVARFRPRAGRDGRSPGLWDLHLGCGVCVLRADGTRHADGARVG
eukprot:2540265-Prymnesium_polylepis.2